MNAGRQTSQVFKRKGMLLFAVLVATVLVLVARPAWAACPPTGCGGGDPPPNSPPIVAADSGSRTVNEGQTATNTGTYSDPDGDPVTLTASSGTVTKDAAGTWSWSFPTTDGPDQTQTVTITADDGTDTVTTTFSLTVNNVAPTVTLQSGPYSSVPEGGSFAKGYTSYGYNLSVSDPGNDTWTLNTGCGANGSEWVESTSTVWCGFFDGPGSSVVSATATDSDGASRTASVNVNVTNMNPNAVLNAPTSIDEGDAATISLTKGGFSFQDGETDTNAGFHYAFDCNGGSLATATYANSGTANSTTCPTTDSGTKTVRARIIDKDGGFNEYTKSITVNNVAPTATFNAPTSANQGNNFTVSLGSVSDPSSTDSANLTYHFDCDDGSGYVSSSTPSTTCNAVDKPSLTVRGKVTDKDGGSNEYTANVTVNNVFPTGTIQIKGGAAKTNSTTVNLTLSASDPLPGSGVGQMRFRNENTTTWSTWEPYATSRAWALSSGDGAKTVFVEYKDNAGNVSQGPISDGIQLDTTTPVDTTAPTVKKWKPTGTRVSPTANVIATFSEAMDEASVEATNASGLPTTFTLKKGTKQIAASVTYSAITTSTGTVYKAVLNPTGKLRSGATYTATLSPDAKDLAGNALVKKTWKFIVK